MDSPSKGYRLGLRGLLSKYKMHWTYISKIRVIPSESGY